MKMKSLLIQSVCGLGLWALPAQVLTLTAQAAQGKKSTATQKRATSTRKTEETGADDVMLVAPKHTKPKTVVPVPLSSEPPAAQPKPTSPPASQSAAAAPTPLPAPAAAPSAAVRPLAKKRAPAQPWRRDRYGILFAPKIGVLVPIRGVWESSFLIGAELGYRPPILKRVLGISLGVQFSNPSVTLSSGTQQVRYSMSRISFPVTLSANVQQGSHLFRIFAGPALNLSSMRTRLLDGSVTISGRNFSVGALAGLGYFYLIGPGGVGLDLQYTYVLDNFPGSKRHTQSLGIQAAYTFLF